MVLSEGKLNQKHALFVSDLETLKGKRKLFEVFYQNFMKLLNFPKEDYQIQIIEARALPDAVVDVFNHLKLKHHQKKLNVSFLLDMYLTSGLAEHTFHFGVFPGNGLIDMLYYQESLPRKWGKFIKPFMFGLLAAAEPYLNMDFAEHFDVKEAMLQAHQEEDSFYLILPKSEKESLEKDPLVIISILDDPNRERLLYTYLSLASGPFHSYIRALEVDKIDKKIVLSFILKANPTGILNFFGRLSAVLIATKSVHLSFPPEYLSGFQNSLQQNASLVAKAYREKATFDAYIYRCGFGEDSGLSPFEVLIKYGMVKCPLSDDDGNGLDNKDRIALGLPVVDMSGYSYVRSKKNRRMAPNMIQKHLQAENFESTSSSDDEDSENEDLIGKDLKETFKLHARLATQARVSNAVVQKKLEAIKRQCQDCEKWLLEQRKLIIFEMFLRIKGLLAKHVTEPSSVLSQLKKNKSPLRKKLEETKIPGILVAVQQALECLEKERLEIAKPVYGGETLYWITSTELQNAFYKLLPAYQAEKFPMPAEESLPLFSIDATPEPLTTMADVVAIKEQREEAEAALRNSQQDYVMIKNESQICLSAYKNREILMVGAVFKAFIDDLKAVTRDGDIIRDAYEESSPVRVKMEEAGIHSASLLRKIYTFVLTHRNVVAHPAVQPLPDDEISRKIEPSLKNLFDLIYKNFETLEKHFTQGEALQGRFD